VDGYFQEEFDQQIKAVYKNHPETVKSVLSLIAHAVAKKLQHLEE
jgi:hypothetical protein